MKVMMIGVGGTGNAILYTLDYSKISQISLVDNDKIEISNLNRQFLFNESDIGKFKVDVAKAWLLKVAPSKIIQTFPLKIQNLQSFMIFDHNVFLIGTDNLESRIFINNTLFDLYKRGLITHFILIDTGAEKMRAHIHVISSQLETACLSCALELFDNSENSNLNYCTINQSPKNFRDCIKIASLKFQYDTESSSLKEVISDIHQEALRVSEKIGIFPESQFFTENFLKHFSINFSSINSIIAGIISELLDQGLNFKETYFIINSEHGLHIDKMNLQKKDDCLICSPFSTFSFCEITSSAKFSDLHKSLKKICQEEYMIFGQENNLLFNSRYFALEENKDTKVKDILGEELEFMCFFHKRNFPTRIIFKNNIMLTKTI